MSEKAYGCGAPAEIVIYRGKGRMRWLCKACPNESSGGVKPWATKVEGQAGPEGFHTGPEHKCGDETL